MREVYDIKGSWVARSAVPPSNGEFVTCRYCEQKFQFYRKNTRRKQLRHSSRTLSDLLSVVHSPIIRTPSRDETSEEVTPILFRCQYTVNGIHEPKVVMKDNDLKDHLRIATDRANRVLFQLRKDCDFLCNSLEVMDYSLLLGVHHAEYDVPALQTTENDQSTVTSPIKDNCIEV